MKNRFSKRIILITIFALFFFFKFLTTVSANTCTNLNPCWTAKSPMPTARREFGIASDSKGNIYVAGGYDGNGNLLNQVEMYNPNTDTWTAKSPMPITRNEIGFAYSNKNGNFYAVGGYNEGFHNDLYEFNPNTNTWTAKSPMPMDKIGFGFIADPDGNLYSIGGITSDGSCTNQVEMYNPNTDTWTAKSPMPTARCLFGSALGQDGLIYAVGGHTGYPNYTELSTVDAYNPISNTWTTKSPMSTQRSALSVSINSKGTLYAIGGNMADNASNLPPMQTNIVEEYNTITDTWITKTPLPFSVMEFGAIFVNDGKVHVIGGWTPTNSATNLNYTEQIVDSMQLYIPTLLQTSNPWQNQTYDGANFWSPSTTTIGRWGCAITSYTMILNYFGIYKLPNGNILNPGTLNTWLKNNNGYIDGKTSGFVNPIAISVLSKRTKQVNNITNFDALEYSRVSESNNTNALIDSINNGIPAILDVGGHFVVAKGINGTTFDINDPYYPDKITLTSYPNGFSYFGKLIPSNTDISYILIAGNKNLHFGLKDSIGNSIGQDYLQEALIDDETNQSKGNSMQILLAPKPSSGTYTLSITGNNGEKKFQIYLYDKNGNLKLMKETINIKDNKSKNINIYFDKNNVKNNKINHGKNKNEFEDE